MNSYPAVLKSILFLPLSIFVLTYTPLVLSANSSPGVNPDSPSVDLRQMMMDRKNMPERKLVQSYREMDQDLEVRLNMLSDENIIGKENQSALRSRQVVTINLDALDVDQRGGRRVGNLNGKQINIDWIIGEKFDFSPNPKTKFKMVTRQIKERNDGGFTIYASMDFTNAQSMYLYFDNLGQLVQGSLNAGRYKYRIHQIPGTVYHLIEEIDGNKLAPPDRGTLKETPSNTSSSLVSPKGLLAGIKTESKNVLTNMGQLMQSLIDAVAPKAYASLGAPVVVDIGLWRTSEISSANAITQ